MVEREEGTTELAAVLVAVSDNEAKVLTVEKGTFLPSGPLTPIHSSLQAGVREWVEKQTHQPLGYVEQLYTFVDTHRTTSKGHFLIYIGYLGLVREEVELIDFQAKWKSWYLYFPWEDHRQGRPDWIDTHFIPPLFAWAERAPNAQEKRRRHQRINMCWGLDGFEWNEEYVLQRYELLYEVGFVPESPTFNEKLAPSHYVGAMMKHDHRRVVASGIARLRAKIKYRPVIFELMPPEFTLLQLQQSIEALAGIILHKQNFRRMIINQDLIEETGELDTKGPGRPAKLYRFKPDILLERSLSGSKLPVQ